MATLFSGATYHALGWEALNLAVAPLLLVALMANLWMRVRGVPTQA